MRVKSATDTFNNFLIGLPILLLSLCLLYFLTSNQWLVAIVCVITIGFLVSIRFFTYYELRDTYLYCRCGLFVEKIKYSSIKSIRLVNNRMSSMALASERIEIKQHHKGYISGTTYISPINRDEFYHKLLTRINSDN